MQPTRTRRVLAAVLSLGLAGLGVLAFPAAASAAEIQVLNTADDGAGSLREVVANAVAGDTIVFKSGVTGTIALESTIEVTQPITISGPGAAGVVLTSTGDLDGPLVYVELLTGGDVTIRGLGFLSGTADEEREGLYAGVAGAPLGVLALDGVSFSGFTEGSAAYVETAGEVTITGSTFTGNSLEDGDGGAVRVGTANDVTITGSTFTDNSGGTERSGGAVYVEDVTGSLEVSDSIFTGNDTLGGSGGALAAGDAGSVSLLRSTFVDNDGEHKGGAVSLDHVVGGLLVEDSRFEANNGGDGGAISLGDAATTPGSSVTISNTQFLENDGGDGGALWLGDVSGAVVVGDSEFSGNDSDEGGGIYFGGAIPATGSVIVFGSAFDDNSGWGGGGIVIEDGVLAPVVVSGSTFTRNHSGDGAGILAVLNVASLTIESSTFADNRTDEIGGTIKLTQREPTDVAVTIASSTFTGNTVSGGGFGVSVSAELESGTVEIVGSTFDEPGGYDETPYALHFRVLNGGAPEFTVRNSTIVAQGGILFDVYDDEDDDAAAGADGNLTVSHTILSTLGAPAITVEGEPGTASLEWSILSDEFDAAVTQGAGNQLGVASIGLGALQDNGGPTMTMLLGDASPALNAGDPAVMGAPAFDQRGAGFPRIVETIDIGAVEMPAAESPDDTPDASPDASLAATGATINPLIFIGAGVLLVLGALAFVLGRRRARRNH